MSGTLFDDPLLPIASEEDARSTCRVALPRIADVDGRVTVVHVVEKAGGAMDKAGVEQRELAAEEMFDAVREMADDLGVPVDAKVVYGTDVPEAIFEAAADVDASAIVFTPRGGSRWLRLLTGDTALSLVTETDRPVVVLPEDATADEDEAEATSADDDENAKGKADDGDRE